MITKTEIKKTISEMKTMLKTIKIVQNEENNLYEELIISTANKATELTKEILETRETTGAAEEILTDRVKKIEWNVVTTESWGTNITFGKEVDVILDIKFLIEDIDMLILNK